MKIKLLIISYLVASILSSTLIAQEGWQYVYPYPTANTISELQVLNEHEIIMSDGQSLIYSLDGGNEWTREVFRVTSGSIYFVSITTGWMVCSNGSILKTTNSGKSWIEQYRDSNDDYRSVCFQTENLGWVVGCDGVILKTTNSGDTWKQISKVTNKCLKDVCFVDNLLGWAVGSEIILNTEDGGETWLKEDYPGNYFKEVDFVNRNEGWIIGDYDGVWHRTMGGEQPWEIQGKQTILGSKIPGCLEFTDSLNGWVSMRGKVVSTNDGGQSWKVSLDLYPKFDFLYGLSFLNSSFGFVAGSDGVIYKTINSGVNWQSLKMNIYDVDFSFKKIFFTDDNTGFIVGSKSKNISGGITGLVLKTEDSGNSWQKVESVEYPIQDACHISNTVGWAIGRYGEILYTEDAWQTYIIQGTRDEILNKIFFINSEIGWIVGDNSLLLKTINGGNSWTNIYGISGYWHDVHFIDSQTGWIVGDNLYQTNDGGISWKVIEEGSINNVYDVFFLDSNYGWVIGASDNHIMLRTTNGGESWEKITIPYKYCFNIFFITNKIGWMSTDNGIKKTIDGGITWMHQNSPSGGALYFLDESTGFCINKSTLLKTYDGGGITGIDCTDSIGISLINTTDFQLSQNYPNPFNPSTVIKYSIPSIVGNGHAHSATEVTLKIYDILGREVATLVNKEQPAGSYEVKFESKELSSGIYFYTLRAGNYFETKKMLLLR